MKDKYRIVMLAPTFYRVDKLHRILFFGYWDAGASDMCPNYRFGSFYQAYQAIKEKNGEYYGFIDKYKK